MRLLAGSALWIGLALAVVAGALVLEPLRRGPEVLPPDDDELEAQIRAARARADEPDR